VEGMKGIVLMEGWRESFAERNANVLYKIQSKKQQQKNIKWIKTNKMH
jgi:hypothetical protein